MGEAAARLLEQALMLPADERIRLAGEIAKSVDEPSDPEWERAWRTELDSRLAQMMSGDEEEVSLETVRQRLRAIASR